MVSKEGNLPATRSKRMETVVEAEVEQTRVELNS